MPAIKSQRKSHFQKSYFYSPLYNAQEIALLTISSPASSILITVGYSVICMQHSLSDQYPLPGHLDIFCYHKLSCSETKYIEYVHVHFFSESVLISDIIGISYTTVWKDKMSKPQYNRNKTQISFSYLSQFSNAVLRRKFILASIHAFKKQFSACDVQPFFQELGIYQ